MNVWMEVVEIEGGNRYYRRDESWVEDLYRWRGSSTQVSSSGDDACLAVL